MGAAKVPPPYARVPDSWLGPLYESGVLTLQGAVFIKLIMNLNDEGDKLWAWASTRSMAEGLGVEERQVSEALRGLRGKGLISVKQRPHRGASTEYWILEGTPEGRNFTGKSCVSQTYQSGESYVWQRPIATSHTRTHNNNKGEACAPKAHAVQLHELFNEGRLPDGME